MKRHYMPKPITAQKPTRSLALFALLAGAHLLAGAQANTTPGLSTGPSTGPSAATASISPEANFLMAKEAFRKGNAARVDAAYAALEGHELQPWVGYYQLRMRLDNGNEAAIQDFLTRNASTLPAEKLRGDWLKVLGKKQRWADFRREWPLLTQPDQELTCYHWQERLGRGDATVYDEALVSWLAGAELPDSCDPVTDAMVIDKRLKLDDVWDRMHRLLEANKPNLAREAGRYLPDTQLPEAKALEAIDKQPAKYLEKLPAGFEQSRKQRELALYAIARIARTDPTEAASRAARITPLLPESEGAYAWSQIGWQGAKLHLPDASAWYEKGRAARLSADQAEWRVRAALWIQDWNGVKRAIESMWAEQAAQPEWVYWLARAKAALGRKDEAQTLYRRIAGQHHFYGNLASEELGQSFSLPPRPQPLSNDELAQAVNNPGLRRGLILMGLDLRTEGVKEWNFSLRGMNDRQLLAAAEFARRNEVLDRAISAADRTRNEHDFALRFPSPLRTEVAAKAQELMMDDSWIYGLIRQESRFVMNAKSGVGARGLMQVMPATAKWVAKKIGLKDYHPGQDFDMATNINLGTNYLKIVYSRLDNHPVLACAAYNAGPGRAQKWRADKPIEGAIYVENIPFNETRDYVKKVMSNSLYYAALFQEKPQSLKTRLGVIQPRNSNSVEDLP